jgi:imidazolonepropionase
LEETILIRGARQLLTLRGPAGIRRGAMLRDLGIISDGAVLIQGRKILAVGPSRRIENLREARSALEIRANGRLVMPGMVDSDMRLMLGGLQIAWKKPSVSKTLQKATAILRSSLQHGTVHAEIKAGGTTPKTSLRDLRHAAKLGSGGGDLVRTWLLRPGVDADPDDFASAQSATITEVVKRRLIHFFEVEAIPQQTAMTRKLFELASRAGVPCKLAWRGAANSELLDIASQTELRSISHLTDLDAHSAELMGQRQVLLSLSPGRDVLERDCNTVGWRVYLDHGGAVVLASGFDPVESPLFNLQMSIALAVFRLDWTPEEAISAATINAAYASGLGARCGSLEHGKDADVVLMNLADYRELPRRFGMNHVGMVIRGGEIMSNRIGSKMTRPVERISEAHAANNRVRP